MYGGVYWCTEHFSVLLCIRREGRLVYARGGLQSGLQICHRQQMSVRSFQWKAITLNNPASGTVKIQDVHTMGLTFRSLCTSKHWANSQQETWKDFNMSKRMFFKDQCRWEGLSQIKVKAGKSWYLRLKIHIRGVCSCHMLFWSQDQDLKLSPFWDNFHNLICQSFPLNLLFFRLLYYKCIVNICCMILHLITVY